MVEQTTGRRALARDAGRAATARAAAGVARAAKALGMSHALSAEAARVRQRARDTRVTCWLDGIDRAVARGADEP